MGSAQRFREKVALVTGAASGIGRAIALHMAREGATVAIHDQDAEGMMATATLIREAGGHAGTYPVDVAHSGKVHDAVSATVADFGSIDILVNDAGINIVRFALDVTDEEWDRVIGVNLTGTWNYCRHVGRQLCSRQKGAIVNIASVAATSASYYRAPYMASKGGVGMLTKALALDFAEFGVRVNAVAPGGVATPMIRPDVKRFGAMSKEMASALTPMRRLGVADEIAEAVAFLASDSASFINGHLLVVDGGMTAGTQIGARWTPMTSSGLLVEDPPPLVVAETRDDSSP